MRSHEERFAETKRRIAARQRKEQRRRGTIAMFLEKCANFPIINANFHIRSNHTRLFQPHYIAEIDGMKILFIGIITEDVLAQTKAEELIGSFVDISEAAQEVGNICNAYNAIDIDFTVLLTHIGFEEDKKLAALLDISALIR